MKGKPAKEKKRAARNHANWLYKVFPGRQHRDYPALHSRSKNAVASLAYGHSKKGGPMLAYDPAIYHLRKKMDRSGVKRTEGILRPTMLAHDTGTRIDSIQ